MRKLLILLCMAVLILTLVVFYSPKDFRTIGEEYDAEYLVYTTREVGTPVFAGVDGTVYVTSNENVGGVIGRELSFKGHADEIDSILFRFFVTKYEKQTLDGVTVFTGHSTRLGGNGDNIQIAYDGETYKIGTPLLLGSY